MNRLRAKPGFRLGGPWSIFHGRPPSLSPWQSRCHPYPPQWLQWLSGAPQAEPPHRTAPGRAGHPGRECAETPAQCTQQTRAPGAGANASTSGGTAGACATSGTGDCSNGTTQHAARGGSQGRTSTNSTSHGPTITSTSNSTSSTTKSGSTNTATCARTTRLELQGSCHVFHVFPCFFAIFFQAGQFVFTQGEEKSSGPNILNSSTIGNWQCQQTFTVGKWNSWGRRRLCGHLWGLRWNKVLSRYPILISETEMYPGIVSNPQFFWAHPHIITNIIVIMLTTYAWFLVNQFPARLFCIWWGARRHGLETIVLCGEKHPESTEENPWSGENRGQVVVGL